ncbi:Endonuclease/exonuclease/phosphatase [Xylogone sp. PMI_703]|nr:Endonuclease/exonuclease/phosphatase [Xylogone sp. PMI_703]
MASLNLYILTFNCARCPVDVDALSSQFFNALTTPTLPDIIVISAQEIAPLCYSFIGGAFLAPYFAKFHDAVQKAAKKLPQQDEEHEDRLPYTLMSANHVGMTGIMVFSRDPAKVQDLETGGVGVGVMETGNKGAAGARFTYTDAANGPNAQTSLTFVAAHLAAMEGEVVRRNEDWKNIVRGLVFSSRTPTGAQAVLDERAASRNGVSSESDQQPLLRDPFQDSSIYKSTSHLFVAGDLNYRTSILKPHPTDYEERFPQPNQEDSSPKHYSLHFENDQLTQERLAGRTLHGLVEPPVTFPPTYKYDNTKGPYLTPDHEISHFSWSKHRWPSWCDRILYLDIPSWVRASHPDAKFTVHKYTALPIFPTSDHRPVAMSITIPLIPIPPPSDVDVEVAGDDEPRIKMPYEVNSEWRANRLWARRMEIVIGSVLYLTTSEGFAVLVATLSGVVGGYYLIRYLYRI